MSETPTAEKAYTALKALQLFGDDDEVINPSSNRIGSSIAVGVLLSSIISMLMFL